MKLSKEKKVNVGFLLRFLPILVVVSIVAIFFTMFIINNNKRVIQQNGAYVEETAKKTASRIGSDLKSAATTLMNIAALCEISPENDCYPENIKAINSATFENIDYINSERHIFRYSNDRDEVLTKDQEYFVEGMAGHTGVYAELKADYLAGSGESTENVSRVLNIYTPVKRDGEPVGVLIGRFAEENLRGLLDSTFFNHKSGVYLYRLDLNQNDKSLIDDVVLLIGSDNSIKEGSIFDIMDAEAGANLKRELERLRSENGAGLTLNFSTKEGTETAYLAFVPGDNNVHPWLVLQTFPAAVTTGMTKIVNLEGLQLGLGLILALALYIAFILIINYVQNKKLVNENRDKSYVVDALIQLYDRFVYVNLDEQRYRYVVDSMPDDAGIDVEGDYRNFRDNVVASFKDDYDKKWLGKKIDVSQIKKDLEDGNNEIRYEYRTKSGKNNIGWEDMSIICLSRNADGQASEVLFARQNISDIKEKELHNQVVLKEAFRAAEDANRAKSDFLSHMSHDIRTPMNAVIGFSTLLEQSYDNPEKVSEYSKKIKASGQHLLGLINDILDMSKIESGKITFNNAEFEISELLDEIGAVIVPQARAKNQSYHLVTSDLRHETYLGDKLRISQILINILSNSVKYTPEGGTIDFSVRNVGEFSDNIDNIIFTVKDNGIGMSEDFLKRVYEPFEREDNSLSSRVQGTGLGMAITKNLVELMGGTIDVKSKVGEGTQFAVNLQMRVAEKSNDHEFWREYNISRTLIVDDERDVCDDVKDLLNFAGLDVDCCTDGYTAYDMVKKSISENKPYDVVLIDLKMPVIDGVETARLIRGELGSGASLLILTAYDWEQVESQAQQAGVDGFMSKPFFVSAFKQSIARLRSKVTEVRGKSVSPLAGMNVLVAEDNELNAEILTELLAISGATCDVAQNGKIAVEMFEKSSAGQYDLILMDVQMPVMDGYAATRAIRASSHPSAKTVPIAAMTANAFADDVKRALKCGMNAHIAKPVSLDVMNSTVEMIKNKKGSK